MKKIILLSQLLAVNFIFGQNWTGFQDADWNNSANWSSWPLNGQSIVIDPALYSGNAVSPIISANSVFSPAAVLMQNGALLSIDADLTTQDDFEVIGAGTSLTMNNGVLNVNPGNGGRLIIDLGATMQMNGGNTIVDERFIAGEDAIVTIDGGTASSGERLLMDLGGRFIQNNGTVNVAATFAMADGSLNSNSSYELNGGTLNVTGEFAMENESGVFEPSFVQNGGILNVNGDVFWFGTAPGAGTPRFIMNAGTATISGIIQNMPLSTVNMYLRLDGSSALNYNGNLIENIHPEDSVIQTGNSSFTLNNNCTLSNAGEFLAENVTTTFNGNTILSGTGNYQFSTVLIESGAVLNHFSPVQIRISGDFNQNGLFNANSNELIFNGAIPQFINGTSSLQAHHMNIDNSLNGLTLQIPVNLTGNLQLTSGVLYTDVVNILSLADNATSGSGNAVSFVNGPFRKVGDDSFVFPVGKNGKWSRMGISAPAFISDAFVAEYFSGSYSSISPVNSPLSAVSNLEYWELNREAGTSDVLVELYWEDASLSSITDCNELSVASWNGTSWDNVFSTASGTCSGTGSGSILSNAPWSNYGAFTFGFYSGVTSQNFTICSGDSIVVGANVYTTSGAYIDVLQDINLNDSIVITNLDVTIVDTGISVAGITLTSNNVNATYLEWIDCSDNAVLLSGATEFSFTPDSNGFYAVIVHENFCVDTSACVEINSVGIEQQYLPEIVVYPNPFDGSFTVELPTYQDYALIELLDLSGKTIVSLMPESNHTFVECDIPSGMYFLQITQKSGEQALKKIVRK